MAFPSTFPNFTRQTDDVDWANDDDINLAYDELEALASATPVAYTIYKISSTYYAKSCLSGGTNYSGTVAATVINNAITALSSGRSWKEKVVLKGDFTVDDTILLPSYIIFDYSEAKITLANSTDKDVIKNSDTTNGNADIILICGDVDANETNQTASGFHGINLWGCTDTFLINPYVQDTGQHGIYLDGDATHKGRATVIRPTASSCGNATGQGKGIACRFQDGSIFYDIYADSSNREGFWSSNADNCRVFGGRLTNNGQSGSLWSYGSTNCIGYGLLAKDNGAEGVATASDEARRCGYIDCDATGNVRGGRLNSPESFILGGSYYLNDREGILVEAAASVAEDIVRCVVKPSIVYDNSQVTATPGIHLNTASGTYAVKDTVVDAPLIWDTGAGTVMSDAVRESGTGCDRNKIKVGRHWGTTNGTRTVGARTTVNMTGASGAAGVPTAANYETGEMIRNTANAVYLKCDDGTMRQMI